MILDVLVVNTFTTQHLLQRISLILRWVLFYFIYFAFPTWEYMFILWILVFCYKIWLYTHLILLIICVVGFQVLLGLSGVMLVMLSVLGSVGFFSAVGIKSTLIIMEVIPFLVLAVSSSCLKDPFGFNLIIFLSHFLVIATAKSRISTIRSLILLNNCICEILNSSSSSVWLMYV